MKRLCRFAIIIVMEELNNTFYDELMNNLRECADPEYAEFQRRIIPDAGEIIGVRMPKLRSIAKKLDYFAFKEKCGDCFEERMLLGLSLAYAKKMQGEVFFAELKYVSHIFRTWAEVDCFCATLKPMDGLFERAELLMHDEAPFAVRTGVIILMDHYLDDEHIDEVLALIDALCSQEYYVRMGAAWALATAYVKYPEKVYPLIEAGRPEIDTAITAIGKCIDSYRVPKEDKERLKALRRRLRTR